MPEAHPIQVMPSDAYSLQVDTYKSEAADIQLQISDNLHDLELEAVAFRFNEADALMAMVIRHTIEGDSGIAHLHISPKYFSKVSFIVTYEKTGLRCGDVEVVVERRQYSVPLAHNKSSKKDALTRASS
jgi:hypothetical protein